MVRGPPPERRDSTSVPCGLSGTNKRAPWTSYAMPSTPSAAPAEGSSNKIVRARAGGRSVTIRFSRCSATARRPPGSSAIPSGASGSKIVSRARSPDARCRSVPWTGSLTHSVPSARASRSSGAPRPRAKTGSVENAAGAGHAVRRDEVGVGVGLVAGDGEGKADGVACVHAHRTSSPAATPRLPVEGRLRDEPNFAADARAAVARMDRDERGARDLSALLDLDVQVAGARTEVHAETRGGGAGGWVFRHADPRREEARFHASRTQGRDAVHAVRVRHRRRRSQRLHDRGRRERQHQLPDADVGDGRTQRRRTTTDLCRVEPDVFRRQTEQREHLTDVVEVLSSRPGPCEPYLLRIQRDSGLAGGALLDHLVLPEQPEVTP